MSGKITIDHLSWDSDFFGIKVAKITLESCDNIPLEETINRLKKEGYKLIYAFSNPNDGQSNRSVLNNKGILVDEKVTYYRKITKNKIAFPDNIEKYNSGIPDERLYGLCLKSGEYSRFKKDHNFASHLFVKLYYAWIENSVSRKIADEVLIYREQQDIVGFVTLKHHKYKSQIGLIAVDDKYQRRSIGMLLITACSAICNEEDTRWLEVITQRDNLGACRFYEKCGFILMKVENIYHIWI